MPEFELKYQLNKYSSFFLNNLIKHFEIVDVVILLYILKISQKKTWNNRAKKNCTENI